MQLALALRLCSDAACAIDPNFLEAGEQIAGAGAMAASLGAEAMSHRFWVNGCLSYYDRVPDGFYMIQGMDPFVWTLCTDVQEESRIPSLESLKTVHPNESPIEVAMIDRNSDSDLRQLQNIVAGLSCSCTTTNDMVEQLAKLVCSRMGGSASNEEGVLLPRWKERSGILKAISGSVVISMGKLPVGLCRHRALIFKMLADTINLPCRVAKGCKYCKCDDSSSCLVRFGPDREYLVDLIGNPGSLCEPDSLLNGPCSISIASPMRPPKFKSVETKENFKALAKQYFLDCQSLNLMFSDASAGNNVGQEDVLDPSSSKRHDVDINFFEPVTDSEAELMEAPHQQFQMVPRPVGQDGILQLQKLSGPSLSSESTINETAQLKLSPQDGHAGVSQALPLCGPKIDNKKKFYEEYQQGRFRPSNSITLALDDLTIPWSEMVLKEKIGAGSFGTVHRADWNGSDVAVKILMEQDFHQERFNEFLREVAIMKSLRHPNIVLYMGAVTQPPNLSIVTEYLSRGSLYRLLHRHGAREVLDERRRLNMAFDVAKGMNYLHKRNPPIVHRDLKSPNLLVDKKYTVKIFKL
ncbi:uncharacterized protein A4U43_C08F6390 [Asparagus officinalis]|nr:uncharacterized protein A4U43_C08F6390 [Asparagus officinalis]